MRDAPIIHRHSDSFDDRNMALHLALGLASVNRTLRGALTPTALDPLDSDAALIDLFVGLIALTDRACEALSAQPAADAAADGGRLDGVSHHTERTLLR